jgi:hypothetical protein
MVGDMLGHAPFQLGAIVVKQRNTSLASSDVIFAVLWTKGEEMLGPERRGDLADVPQKFLRG